MIQESALQAKDRKELKLAQAKEAKEQQAKAKAQKAARELDMVAQPKQRPPPKKPTGERKPDITRQPIAHKKQAAITACMALPAMDVCDEELLPPVMDVVAEVSPPLPEDSALPSNISDPATVPHVADLPTRKVTLIPQSERSGRTVQSAISDWQCMCGCDDVFSVAMAHLRTKCRGNCGKSINIECSPVTWRCPICNDLYKNNSAVVPLSVEESKPTNNPIESPMHIDVKDLAPVPVPPSTEQVR